MMLCPLVARVPSDFTESSVTEFDPRFPTNRSVPEGSNVIRLGFVPVEIG